METCTGYTTCKQSDEEPETEVAEAEAAPRLMAPAADPARWKMDVAMLAGKGSGTLTPCSSAPTLRRRARPPDPPALAAMEDNEKAKTGKNNFCHFL